MTHEDEHERKHEPARERASTASAGAMQSGVRVLVIDDEPEIQRAIRARLAGVEFAVSGAVTAAEGIEQVARWHPDVVILDLTLPDMDGIEVVRRLRTWNQVPIIVLSVRGGDADKITALELGADDYLTKPFSSGELVARIRVALRHAVPAGDDGGIFETDGLVLDLRRRLVTVDGREVHLTPTEYAVLTYLARNAGKVITHRTLLQAVWGPQYETEDHYLHVFIGQLRRKLEPTPSRPHYVLTEPGVGYRLRSPD